MSNTSTAQLATTYSAIVRNPIKPGYRRAGLVLQQGENHLHNLNAEQLAQLQQDRRLSVQVVSEQGLSNQLTQREKTLSLLPDNASTDLTKFTVEQLKAQLQALNIPFKGGANKAELVALLQQHSLSESTEQQKDAEE